MTIGDRIKENRLLKKFTLEELAKEVGTSKQTIQRYETGVISNIPSDRIEAIASALGTTPAYLMGWENTPTFTGAKYPAPNITDDYTTFPVIGDIAAGYDSIAIEKWDGDLVDIPNSYLRGHDKSDFFVLCVKGDSMFPTYQDGDKVLILKQSTLNYSGQIGAILYDNECATLKKVEYSPGENWIKLIPINPIYPPKKIMNEDLERCNVIGIPKLLIRDIE